MVTWLINRLKEPSTYAGFAGIALALGISGVLWEAVTVAAVGVFSLLAVLLAERTR